MPSVAPIDTRAAEDWYRRNRARSEAIFDLIDPSAYYSRPISLRNPIVFYEGHLPAFSVIAFLRRGLGLPPVDARLEQLFERGIDPDSEAVAVPRSGASTVWPSRDEVRAFGRACDDAVLAAMAGLAFDSLPVAQARAAHEGLYTALEHEAMHQETLLYMWHRLPYEQKRDVRGADMRGATREAGGADGRGDRREAGGADGRGARREAGGMNARGARREAGGAFRGDATAGADTPASVIIPAGFAQLGADRNTVAFGWDNEFEAHDVHVAAFDLDTLPVTNAQYLEFLDAGGYTTRELWSEEGWEWLGAEAVTHPAFWLPAPRASRLAPRASATPPASHLAPRTLAPPASDLAPPPWQWRGMFEALPLPLDWPVYVSHAEASAYARWTGRRLMTEAEFHRAAAGSTPGHMDFAGFDPIPVGSDAPSAAGVYDLVGNGWEWTSTVFGPFDGFVPMRSYPEYSADFFDGRHFVMKGASPATARELVRPSFRNWFRGNYPYVYAKFRTAK